MAFIADTRDNQGQRLGITADTRDNQGAKLGTFVYLGKNYVIVTSVIKDNYLVTT